MVSTHIAELDLPALPPSACIAHLFPALTDTSLLSIGQLCDAGCTATFDADSVTIQHQSATILTGHRDPITRLWNVPLTTTPDNNAPKEAAFSSVNHASKPAELIAFAHAALFSPALSTLQTALHRNFITNFPGLTSELLRRHPPNSVATIKGHLDQTRQHKRPTPKPSTDLPLLPIDATLSDDSLPANVNSPEDDDAFPSSPVASERTNLCFAACMPSAPNGQIFTDQTGRFILPSSTGNTQLFLLYDYDSNSIHAEPMPSKSGAAILHAYKTVHNRLVHAGLRPQLQKLDNECSTALKQFLREEHVDFQLVPPGIHRANAAERAIRTFKNHFIAGLCSTDRDFPLHLWDRLLPQAVLTLNLMRGSRINPNLSAWAQVYGQFDFNRTPIAPPGTRVLVHVKPDLRGSWSPHALDGWYVGPALDHYRCYRVWMWETQRERTPDTVTWFPQHVSMPIATSVDIIIAGAHDIIRALQNPSPGSQLAPLHLSEVAALRSIAEILLNRALPSDAVPAPPSATPLRVADATLPTTPTADTDPISHCANPVAPSAPAAPSDIALPPPIANPASTPPPLPQRFRFDPNLPDTTGKYTIKSRTRRHRPDLPAPEPVLRVPLDSTIPLTPHPVPMPDTITAPATKPTIASDNSDEQETPNTFTVTTDDADDWHTVSRRRSRRTRKTPVKLSDGVAPRRRRTPKHKDYDLAACTTHSTAAAIHCDTGELVEYQKLLKSSDGPLWERSCTEEIARLAQGFPPGGIPRSEGTETIFFIAHTAIPTGRKATYLRLVVTDRPQKAQPRRVRMTVGGDRIDYPGEVSTKTSSLSTAKILFNSVVSTPDAKFMTMDIKDFYLNTPMSDYEYMRIHIRDIPQAIFEYYNLGPLVHNDHVYVEIRRGMYGLPQAGRIANDELVPHLAKHGYIQAEHTPGLFTHTTRPISFCLVVDDFGVKYVGREHAEHLRDTLQAKYKITTDWSGDLYLGINLLWDYNARTVDLSMPDYVGKALQRFNHPKPTRPQHAPHAWAKPQYGVKTQLTAPADTSAPLDKAGILRLQEIIGVFLYYARAIDSTMLVALGTLAAAQTQATAATAKAAAQLLDYAATHPDAVIRYTASPMLLHVHSDASYLSEAKARSRAGGLFFLSGPTNAPAADPVPPANNGAIHVNSVIMRNVLASATEAEVGALFHNAQDACMLRQTLTELGHPQPATPIQTDNACAEGIINDTVKQKRSKAIDMRFYWVRDRSRQGQFVIHWKAGALNRADYFTKHHPPAHHQTLRPTYLLPRELPADPPSND
jgi:hypothetical protein